MNIAETDDMANAVNQFNTTRMQAVQRRVNAFLGVMLALALAVGGAFALIHFATPCEGASLCMAAAIPTHRNWLQRVLDVFQAWRLRYAIRNGMQDLHFQHEQLELARWECEHIPKQQAVTRAHIDALMAQLDALELPAAR